MTNNCEYCADGKCLGIYSSIEEAERYLASRGHKPSELSSCRAEDHSSCHIRGILGKSRAAMAARLAEGSLALALP